MKTAIITGITGQDGRFLSQLLLAKDYHVIGLVASNRMKKNSQLAEDFAEIELREVDFKDSDDLFHAISDYRPDELYNLVAASSVKYSFDHPFDTAEITAMTPIRILEVLRKSSSLKDLRFYQASSSEMFGNSATSRKSEESEFAPTSPYAIAKLFAHQSCQVYRKAYGMFISCGILFNHESSYRSEDFVSRKISRQVARIVTGQSEKLTLGSLTPYRDWGFAGDYVEAMWLMLQHDKPDDFIVASGKPHSVLDFASEALQVAGLPGDPHSYIETDSKFIRPLEISANWGDASKAREELGWQPKVSFEELVKMMVLKDIEIEIESGVEE
jgi:GDPmannose 4,6-dehydratase